MKLFNKDPELSLGMEQNSAAGILLIKSAGVNLFAKILKSLPVFYLLVTALIMAAMWFKIVYEKLFGKGTFHFLDYSSLVLLDIYNALFYLVIPALFAVFILREPLSELGLKPPANLKRAAIFTILALVVLVPYICQFAHLTNFQKFYSMHDSSFTKLIVVNVFINPFYYFSEEFFFRGFLFLYLWKKVGWHSFWITDVFFTLSHLFKPGLEILLCIPASIVFNCLTLATRSFYPAFIVHYTLGVVLLLMVNLAHYFPALRGLL
jgi:membrane protease YdiL (CAAX protease family)